jgi:hypothetical protein
MTYIGQLAPTNIGGEDCWIGLRKKVFCLSFEPKRRFPYSLWALFVISGRENEIECGVHAKPKAASLRIHQRMGYK